MHYNGYNVSLLYCVSVTMMIAIIAHCEHLNIIQQCALTFYTHAQTHTQTLLLQDLNRQVQEYNRTRLQAQQDIHHLHETTQRKEHTI